MKQVTLAWCFETPEPLGLDQVRKALRPLGVHWITRESDYAYDSIIGRLTESARARIFEIGLDGWLVNLTVEAEREADLDTRVAEATHKLLGEVLPLLRARDIIETEPE